MAQGIWFLVGEFSPVDIGETLLDPGVSTESRLECIQVHPACLMWWHIFPVWRDQRAEPSVTRACLEVMRECHELPSDLCQPSAVHGLNHWYRQYGREADSIVDAFLQKQSTSAKVREYAAVAQVGGPQGSPRSSRRELKLTKPGQEMELCSLTPVLGRPEES